MTDDQLLLASAYLDDDLDPADRARAEADADVMAEVARLRVVRDALRDVEAPAAERRQRAIAVALRAFTDEPAVVAPPVPLRPRRAWWGAAAAAALVVVLAGGIAIVGGDGDGGDDDSAAEVAPAAADTEAPAEELTAADRGDQATAADATSGAGAAGTAVTEEAAEETAAAGDVLLAPPELRTPADLLAFAADGVQRSTGEAAAPTCDQPGQYLGPATSAGRAVEVFATATQVTAYDVSTCSPVLSVRR